MYIAYRARVRIILDVTEQNLLRPSIHLNPHYTISLRVVIIIIIMRVRRKIIYTKYTTPTCGRPFGLAKCILTYTRITRTYIIGVLNNEIPVRYERGNSCVSDNTKRDYYYYYYLPSYYRRVRERSKPSGTPRCSGNVLYIYI